MSERARLLEAASRSGHTSMTWSIMLDATVTEAVEVASAVRRLEDGWPSDRLGPSPEVREVSLADLPRQVAGMGDRHYGPNDPLARVAFCPGPVPHVVVAAYHGALDGLGLIALLALVTGQEIGSSIRGVDPAAAIRPAGPAHMARRVLEALVRPPARFEPDRKSSEGGDHLLDLDLLAGSVGTAELVSASAAALRRWNRERGARTRRVVAAVAASRRPGREATLSESSAWFRVGLTSGEPEEVRRRLRGRPPEPRGSPTMSRPAMGAVARLLAPRLGSSVFVSNLGRLEPAGPVVRAALHTAALGRSGVGIGGVTVGSTLTLTMRARRSDFSREGAARMLSMAAEELRRTKAPGATRADPPGRSGPAGLAPEAPLPPA